MSDQKFVSTRPHRARKVMVAAVVMTLAVAVAACQPGPQTPGGTPSGCSASIAGRVEAGTLVSGTDRTTVHFPAGAEIKITGTVKNERGGFNFALAWELTPLTSGGTRVGETATVDATWTNGGDARDVEVKFQDSSGFAYTYQWDLHLSATGSGCPPANPEACAKAGGVVFYAKPTVVDGQQREGCYGGDSCVIDIPAQGENTVCDPDDIYTKSQANGPGFVELISGAAILVVGEGAGETFVAGVLGAAGFVVVAVVVIVVAGYVIRVVIPAIEGQAERAVEAVPGVAQNVTQRMPKLLSRNPGIPVSAQAQTTAITAMDTCIEHISIAQVIAHAADFGLVPAAIDPTSGIVTLAGGVLKHVCEIVPTFMPGGATHIGGASTLEASLHIRDVLYGEHNRPETYPTSPDAPPNPNTPQAQWGVLTRANDPVGTTDRTWMNKLPYSCQGSAAPPPATACDEWPWYRTRQGGPANGSKPMAHLRIINASDNSNGGSDLNSFYSGTGCSLGVGASFAVVPWPTSLINAGQRSYRLCPT